MDNNLLVIYVTCPIGKGGELAETLVTQKLAACVNIMPVKSIYSWKGELCRDDEELLIIKSRVEKYAELESKIREIHPYDMPEIVAVEAGYVQKAYLDWVLEQTQSVD